MTDLNGNMLTVTPERHHVTRPAGRVAFARDATGGSRASPIRAARAIVVRLRRQRRPRRRSPTASRTRRASATTSSIRAPPGLDRGPARPPADPQRVRRRRPARSPHRRLRQDASSTAHDARLARAGDRHRPDGRAARARVRRARQRAAGDRPDGQGRRADVRRAEQPPDRDGAARPGPAEPARPRPTRYDAPTTCCRSRTRRATRPSYTYNAPRQVLTTTDARDQTTTNVYDADGQPARRRTGRRRTTSTTLHLRRTRQRADADGHGGRHRRRSTRYDYDAFGQPDEGDGRARPRHDATRYDPNGNRLTQTTTRTTRTAAARRRRCTTAYELRRQRPADEARSIRTATFTRTRLRRAGPAGRDATTSSSRRTTYDVRRDGPPRRGRPTPTATTEESHVRRRGPAHSASSDRGGTDHDRTSTTRSGRLKKTTFPDTTFTENTYDAAGPPHRHEGRPRQDDDVRVRHGRPADEGRRSPCGRETVFTYDANGNQETVTRRAWLRRRRYEYDALNRRTKTIFPSADGQPLTTSTTTAYDELGRRDERDATRPARRPTSSTTRSAG